MNSFVSKLSSTIFQPPDPHSLCSLFVSPFLFGFYSYLVIVLKNYYLPVGGLLQIAGAVLTLTYSSCILFTPLNPDFRRSFFTAGHLL
jgi:hypothetical protein